MMSFYDYLLSPLTPTSPIRAYHFILSVGVLIFICTLSILTKKITIKRIVISLIAMIVGTLFETYFMYQVYKNVIDSYNNNYNICQQHPEYTFKDNLCWTTYTENGMITVDGKTKTVQVFTVK